MWIECDSRAVTQCLTNSHYAPPWQLHTRRLNCLDMLKVMEFHISHIYREGNKVADLLANMGLVGYIPPFIGGISLLRKFRKISFPS